MVSELTQDLDVLTAPWSPAWLVFYYNCINRNDALLLNVKKHTGYTQYHEKFGFFSIFPEVEEDLVWKNLFFLHTRIV